MSSNPVWILAGGRQLLPASSAVAGIVNVTPDSFSDGGRFETPAEALLQVQRHVQEGAHIVDIGAESTRPGATDVGPCEEWRRLAPVLTHAVHMRGENRLPPFFVSVDTFRASTARAACLAGADIINDVSGTLFEPAMIGVLTEFKPGFVLGHSPERPAVMQRNPRYGDVVESVMQHFSTQLNVLVKAGFPEENICLDPCIGFAKTAEHCFTLMRAVPQLKSFGRPLFLGVSRKSFLATILGSRKKERDTLTQTTVALLAAKGVAVHRVHDVAAARATLKLVELLAEAR